MDVPARLLPDGQGVGCGRSIITVDIKHEWPLMFYIYGYDGATAPYTLTIRQ